MHCVHGQSRSCAVCIAFLMQCYFKKDSFFRSDVVTLSVKRAEINDIHEERILHVCYDIVKRSRPCMAVNPGFMQQLEIFRQMKCASKNVDGIGDIIPNSVRAPKTGSRMISSRAHATFRIFRAKGEFYRIGNITKDFCTIDEGQEKMYSCQKCSQRLFSSRNVVLEISEEENRQLPASDYWINSCGGEEYCRDRILSSGYINEYHERHLKHPQNVLKVEPMEWMRRDMSSKSQQLNSIGSQGVLSCPKCTQEIGRWDWCYPDLYSCILILMSKIELRTFTRRIKKEQLDSNAKKAV